MLKKAPIYRTVIIHPAAIDIKLDKW